MASGGRRVAAVVRGSKAEGPGASVAGGGGPGAGQPSLLQMQLAKQPTVEPNQTHIKNVAHTLVGQVPNENLRILKPQGQQQQQGVPGGGAMGHDGVGGMGGEIKTEIKTEADIKKEGDIKQEPMDGMPSSSGAAGSSVGMDSKVSVILSIVHLKIILHSLHGFEDW